MRWLVTFSKSLVDDQWKPLLQDMLCEIDEDAEPIPMDADFVVEVDGPANLPEVAKGNPEVLAVHPSSEMNLY